MKFSLRALCAVGVSLAATAAVPFTGYLYGWAGVALIVGCAGLVVLWLGSLGTASDPFARIVALGGAAGVIPLVLGIGTAIVARSDPLGPAWLISGLALFFAVMVGAFVPGRRRAT